MKHLGILLLCLLCLPGCGKEENTPANIAPEKGTPEYYYELGYESSDPAEKLEFYNTGLELVEDPQDTILPALLEGKIYAMSRLGELEATEVWIDSLIKVAELQGDLFYHAKGYYRKAVMNRYLSNPEAVFENNFLSRQLYLKMGDTAMAARRSLDMANAQYELGDLTGAQESATEALKFLDAEKDAHYVSSAHNVVGLSYMNLGFYKEAREEFHNALSFATSRKDSISYLHNIAIAHKNEGNFGEALNILEDIIHSSEPDTESRNRFLDNYYYMKWLQDSAVKVEDELLAVVEARLQRNDREGLITSYSHLSDYYGSKDPVKSKAYAEAMFKAAKENRTTTSEVDALSKLISLSSGAEKDIYLDRYMSLSDSLQEAGLRSKAHFAKVRFDEERKQQQINLLRAENVSQALRTEKLRTRTVIISLIAFLILFTAMALIYYFRQRAKKEKLREIYLTERRISKRIHDELANDIYNVMSTLENVAPVPVVDKLEKIYHRTREFSRENNEIDTGESYVNDLLSMLSHATPANVKLIVKGEQEINWSRLEPEKKIVLYRILQEMMVNMKKHSKASLVALIFSTEKNLLKVRYSDNGIGTTANEIHSGNGIKNICMRLKTVNGKPVFDTEGKGLKSEISIPLIS
ncbi:tetratricopeptide repeat-containing sensor histidine kinase [Salinimicrobium xinjiangense]|uniref:tetratricopeptide repeat-containing sensor histidine kinase n=1 Tax=Salinimicrobium xinjiangense TaxID=438596 RepID=UPI00040C7AC6|nr:tetratricopeptide repeat-containing sensor histidine kinase [Salinimicrobium xinjiangense]